MPPKPGKPNIMPQDLAEEMGAEMGDMEKSPDSYAPEPKATEAKGASSFFISPSDLGKTGDCQPGDTLKLKVIGTDVDGNYEVSFAGVSKAGEGDESLAGELQGAMSESDDIGPVQNIIGES